MFKNGATKCSARKCDEMGYQPIDDTECKMFSPNCYFIDRKCSETKTGACDTYIPIGDSDI